MVVLHTLLLLAELAGWAAAQTTVTVNTKSTLQTIDGFGFSQAFGRATEFKNANSAAQKTGLDLLFSTTSGAGFSIIRNRIGSGGAGDSIEPTNPGSPSATPNYTWNSNDSGQLWFTKQAVSYGVKTIYADAWSAPGFMKTSGNEAKAGYLCGTTGHTCSSGDWRQAYANFLVQYVKYYAQEGITVTHLGFLNEPDYSPGYSQMQISSNAQEAISFIPTLHKTVEAAGLHTNLTCCDAMGWSSQAKYTAALKSADMEPYLGVITSHTYSSEATTPINTRLPTWITESGTGSASAFIKTWYASGAAGEGFTWAAKLATALVNANASAYLYWEGFEVGQTQSGSHLVDATGSTATPSGILWAFAMWSRFVRPGAVRLQAAGSPSGVITGAFKNVDGSVVVVFTNTGGSTQQVKAAFDGFTPKSASAWLTDRSHTVASTSAPLSGGAVTVLVPSKGVVTVKLS
ncbi:glycoside hydrolase family GH30 [Macrophomina phaseolina]|uniref:Glycoside hydrolase family GH30 n=1 Tax=Macrophomina phaseolina TaxID=35725 RepID=A0ABQ8FTR9_9PEZI|nr:glycoside hydrolase family GH30 [Macrophomina phaseolina]